jgi:hypothetical protein
METSKSKENTKGGIPNGEGKDGGVVEILHIATGDTASLILGNRSRLVSLDIVFS